MQLINNDTDSFKSSIFRLLTIAAIVFLIASYFLIQTSVNSFRQRVSFRALMVENKIDKVMENAHQIIFSLSYKLGHEKISLDNKKIKNLVDVLDYEIGIRKIIPLYSFKIFDANDMVIYRSIEDGHVFTPSKSTRHLSLLKQLRESEINFKVEEMRHGSTRHKEDLIPFCHAIKNLDNKYVGAVCSGLIVKDLNNSLNDIFFNVHTSRVRIVDKALESKSIDLLDVKKVINISNLIKYYVYGDCYKLYFPLAKYPYLLESELNFHYLIKDVLFILLYSIGLFIALILIVYLICLLNKEYYYAPFKALEEKATLLLKDITKSEDTSALNVLDSINLALNYCHLARENDKNKLLKQSDEELNANMMYLMLVERHYSSCYMDDHIDIGKLYVGQLKKLATEKYITISILKFLEEVTKYCCEYYHELKVNIIIARKDCRDLTFKHAALTEAIFHIFTLIIRIGRFEVEDGELILRASFDGEFPTIAIEANICPSSTRALGWTSGITFVYFGFLSIYLLARENNLLFRIEQEDHKIIFILEPIKENILLG